MKPDIKDFIGQLEINVSRNPVLVLGRFLMHSLEH